MMNSIKQVRTKSLGILRFHWARAIMWSILGLIGGMIWGNGVLSAQDLWDDAGTSFRTSGNLTIGSIIEVVFEDDLEVFFESQTIKNKTGNYNDIPVLGEFLAPLLGARGSAIEAERNVTLRSRERTSGGIGAVITGYNALNNTYTLNARRSLGVNGQEREVLAFVAEVNAEDVDDERMVLSSKLANLTFQYENRENNIALTERDFEQLSFPSREEVAAALALLREFERDQALAAAEEVGTPSGDAGSDSELLSPGVAGSVEPTGELLREPPVVPEVAVELTAAKKRELFLKLLNVIINDWY